MPCEIELDEDAEFQRRYWRFQRAGWALLVCLLAAAGLGLFGGGPLSHGRAGHGNLTVEYDRFVRRNAPTLIVVQWQVLSARAETLQIALDAEYVRDIAFQRITPQPVSTAATGDKVTFEFMVNSQPGVLSFHFEAKPRSFGRQAVRIMVAGLPAVRFWQLVYP